MRALNAYWVMAAEHGLNASTFAVRVAAPAPQPPAVGSRGGSGDACGTVARRGGVLGLLDEAYTVSDIKAWLTEKVRMGFGHRVYRTRDPRAEALYQIFEG